MTIAVPQTYILLYNVLLYRVFLLKKERKYKADLKYSNYHSNYCRTEQKIPFRSKAFSFYKHPKLALTGIST